MISFAGVDLSLGDPGGQVQAWVDRYIPLDDLVHVCDPASYRDGRARPQGSWPHAVGLPTFNWHLRPPRWRLNSLWWPTGASRFAIGLFLTDLTGANAIQQAITNAGGAGTLEMSDGSRTLSVTMYALPMRPLGAIDGSNPVVLLPLVDARYFWHGMRVGSTTLSPTSTWSDVASLLTATVGAGATMPTPADYPAPDWSEFARYHESAALALDGYAATVGQRFVAFLSGGYAFQTHGSANAIAGSNVQTAQKIAGGACLTVPAVAPGQVAVVFPRRQGGVAYGSGRADVVSVPASTFGFSDSAPGGAVIHSTFQANYSARGGTADNAAALSTVANAIARDFYGWRRQQYSVSVPGIASNWIVTGFDDYLWFQLGTQVGSEDPCGCDDDEPQEFAADPDERPSPYLAQTLIQSLPPNFGVEENLTQATVTGSPRTFRPSPVVRAELTSGWTYPGGGNPGYATARMLYSDADGVLTKDPHNVRVFDTLNIGSGLSSGQKAWLSAMAADSEMFELVTTSGGTRIVVFELSGILGLVMAGEASALVCTLSSGEYVTTAEAITVCDPFFDPGCWDSFMGFRGIAAQRSDGKFDVLYLERPALIIEYQLYDPMSAGSALATVLSFYQQGNKDISDVDGRVTVYDPLNAMPTGQVGQKGLAIWNDRRLRYEIIPGTGGGGTQAIVFQLTEDKLQGNEANAVLCGFAAGVWTATATAIVVSDALSGVGAVERSQWNSPSGARGVAFLRADGKYEIVYMQRPDMFAWFSAADWRSTDPNLGKKFKAFIFDIDTLKQSFGHGDLPIVLDSNQNFDIWDEAFAFPRVRPGSVGLCVWNDVNNRYEVIFATQPPGEVRFFNNTGLDAVNGEILDAVAYDDDETSITAATPSITLGFQTRWLVATTPLLTPQGKIGFGTWLPESGPVNFDTDDGLPQAGETWGPEPDSVTIHKNRPGFRILQTNPEFSVVQAVQHDVRTLFGKFAEDLEQGGSAKFEIWFREGDPPKLKRSPWPNIDVYDSMLNKGERIEKGTRAWVRDYTGYWEWISAYCTKSDNDEDNPPGAAADPFAGAGSQFAPQADVAAGNGAQLTSGALGLSNGSTS